MADIDAKTFDAEGVKSVTKTIQGRQVEVEFDDDGFLIRISGVATVLELDIDDLAYMQANKLTQEVKLSLVVPEGGETVLQEFLE